MPAIATATAARLQRSVERRWRVTLAALAKRLQVKPPVREAGALQQASMPLREPVQEAAVDRDDGAVDVRGLRRGEEAHSRGDLLRCAEAAGRDRIDDLRRRRPVAAVERA